MGNVASRLGLDHPGLVRRTHHVREKRGWDRSDLCKTQKKDHRQEVHATRLPAPWWGMNTR